jgi:hypothetical protein
LHLAEAPTNEQQPPPASDEEESRHRKEEFPLAIATVHTVRPGHTRRRDDWRRVWPSFRMWVQDLNTQFDWVFESHVYMGEVFGTWIGTWFLPPPTKVEEEEEEEGRKDGR